MAQKQSRSSIFATQPLKLTLIMLMFDNLKVKQMLQPVSTAMLTEHLQHVYHGGAQGNVVAGCLINRVLEMSALFFQTGASEPRYQFVDVLTAPCVCNMRIFLQNSVMMTRP